MGIKNLAKAIKKFAPGALTPLGDLSVYRGQRCAVDAPIFMYKFKAVGADLADAFENQVLRFRRCGVRPYYFFDGAPCKEKMPNIAARRKSRVAAREKLVHVERELEHVRKCDIRTLANPFAVIVAAEENAAAARRRVASVPSASDMVFFVVYQYNYYRVLLTNLDGQKNVYRFH